MIVWPACMSTHMRTVPAEARGGLTRLLGSDIWLKTTQHLPAPQQLLLREDAQALFEAKLVAWEPWRNEIEDLKVMDPLRPGRSLLWLRVTSLPDTGDFVLTDRTPMYDSISQCPAHGLEITETIYHYFTFPDPFPVCPRAATLCPTSHARLVTSFRRSYVLLTHLMLSGPSHASLWGW